MEPTHFSVARYNEKVIKNEFPLALIISSTQNPGSANIVTGKAKGHQTILDGTEIGARIRQARTVSDH